MYLRWGSAGGQDEWGAGLRGRCFLESGLADLESAFPALLLEHGVQLVRSRVDFPGTHASFRATDGLKEMESEEHKGDVKVCRDLTSWRCICPFCSS